VFLVLFFIKGKNDGYLFIFFYGIGNLAAGAISIFVAWYFFKLRFIRPSVAEIGQELKEGWHITISNLSNYGSQYANVFILRLFTNDLIVGYYSIAERIFFAMRQALANFSQVMYPEVCRLIQSGRHHMVLFFRQIYFPFLYCVLAGCAVLFIFSPQVLHFFSGNRNEEPVLLLRIMCVISVIVCTNIPAALVLLATNKKKNYLRISAIGSLLNIIANIILVPFFAAKGTVISICITEIFITAGFYWEVHRLFGLGELKLKKN
jgi:PST family polysaccharide transporter